MIVEGSGRKGELERYFGPKSVQGTRVMEIKESQEDNTKEKKQKNNRTTQTQSTH